MVTTTADSLNAVYSKPPTGALTFQDTVPPSDVCNGTIISQTTGNGVIPPQTTYSCQTGVTLSPGVHTYNANYTGLSRVWEHQQAIRN